MSVKSKAFKRIVNDLKENALNPIDGIKIYIPDNEEDLFNLHCEIEVLYGMYEGIKIHTIIHIPENYPIIGPAMNIADDFSLPRNFHEHILGTSICNDMLTNFSGYFQMKDTGKEIKKASGWSSGYSLNVILSQMQIFFADPDLPSSMHLTKQQTEKIKQFSINYNCKGCSKKNQFQIETTNAAASGNAQKTEEQDACKKRLVCGLTKNSLFSDSTIVLGYPLLITIDRFGRLWPQPLLELLSYDGYIGQIQQSGIQKLEDFEHIKMFSPNGDPYNYWIPCYLNEEHFNRGIETIKNCISVIRYGIQGTQQNDFKPEMVLEVLPCLLNKTTVLMLNGTMFHSLAAIQAYCHFLRLYYKFLQLYPKLKRTINDRVRNFLTNSQYRTKRYCPDLGEFIINLFLSDYKYQDSKQILVQEFFARQIYWIESKEKKVLEVIPQNDLLNIAFEHTKVGNHLLVFNLMAAKWFIDEQKMNKIDGSIGFLPEKVINDFRDVIVKIKSISEYGSLINAIEMSSIINSKESMIQLLFSSKQRARDQKYIN